MNSRIVAPIAKNNDQGVVARVSSPTEICPISYRVILCKYNEIALKSAKYQAKILKILGDSIKAVCGREGLDVQSILTLHGRLIFFFPTADIPRAIKVFKYIIGVQSYAPAVSSPRKLATLGRKCADYLAQLSKNMPFQRFSLTFRNTASPQPTREAIIEQISNYLPPRHPNGDNPVKYSEVGAEVTLNVEIREKGAYIYHEEYPTYFAGFPMESKKAFLMPWRETQAHFLAAMLLVRRGGIVVPVISQPPSTAPASEKIFPKDLAPGKFPLLAEIAKYYPAPLPVVCLNWTHGVHRLKDSDFSDSAIQEGGPLILTALQQIGTASIAKAQFMMGDRKLHFKGIILAIRGAELATKRHQTHILFPQEHPSQADEKAFLPIFYPLAGLPDSLVANAYDRYIHCPQTFSFHQVTLDYFSEQAIQPLTRINAGDSTKNAELDGGRVSEEQKGTASDPLLMAKWNVKLHYMNARIITTPNPDQPPEGG